MAETAERLAPGAVRLGGVLALGGLIGLVAGTCGDAEVGRVVLVSLAVLGFSLLTMHLVTGVFSVRRLTIPAVFFWFFLVRIYFPSLWVYLNETHPRRELYFVAVQSAMLLIPLGALTASIVLGVRRHQANQYFAKAMGKTSGEGVRLTYGLLMVMGLALMVVHIVQVPTVPLIYLVLHPGQFYEIAVLREASFKTLALPTPFLYLFGWNRDIFLPLACMIALGQYRLTESKLWRIRFVLSLAVALFYALFSGAKAPAAELVLKLLLFAYLMGLLKANAKSLLLSVVLVLGFPFLLVALIYGRGIDWVGSMRVLRGIMLRVFHVPAQVLFHYFEYFPYGGELLHGRTIGFWCKLTGQPLFNSARYVYQQLFPNGLATGVSNAAYLGDAFADFGMSGAHVMSFIVGLVLQSIQICMVRLPKNVVTLAFYATIAIAVTALDSTNLFVVLATKGVGIALFLMVCVLLFVVPRARSLRAGSSGLAVEGSSRSG